MQDTKHTHFGNLKAGWNSWPSGDWKWLMWHWKFHMEHKMFGEKKKKRQETNIRGCDFSLNNSMDDQIWSWNSSAIMAMQILSHGWTAGELWTLAIMLTGISLYSLISLLVLPITSFLYTEITAFSDEISVLPQEFAQRCPDPCLEISDTNTTEIIISYTI